MADVSDGLLDIGTVGHGKSDRSGYRRRPADDGRLRGQAGAEAWDSKSGRLTYLMVMAALVSACSQPFGGETWRYERQHDAIRDQTFTRATLGSNERQYEGSEFAKAGLYIEHGSPEGDAIWLAGRGMDCSAGRPVLVRFDGGDVTSIDCAAGNLPDLGQSFSLPDELIPQVEASRVMVVQFGTRSGAPNQMTFRVAGLTLDHRSDQP